MTEIKHGQSLELLKELHILTADGKLNQDSRRKLKQIYHLYNFIEPLLTELLEKDDSLSLVDHGAGKSYLGFIIYDLFFKPLRNEHHHIYGIEARPELVEKSERLRQRLGFVGMSFLHTTVAASMKESRLPTRVDVVTALHACNTATDEAIDFALRKNARHIVLIPCCQAEVASVLRQNKKFLLNSHLVELYRTPLHTREFGSHLTNVLRTLRLQALGYDVTVTELVGFEHSMKNELILARHTGQKNKNSADRLAALLSEFKIQELSSRFSLSAESI